MGKLGVGDWIGLLVMGFIIVKMILEPQAAAVLIQAFVGLVTA